jgi:hypothetical protein
MTHCTPPLATTPALLPLGLAPLPVEVVAAFTGPIMPPCTVAGVPEFGALAAADWYSASVSEPSGLHWKH